LVATITNFGHIKSRRITRLVVLPDYQGVGIGRNIANYVGNFETKNGYKISLVTSNAMMITGLSNDDNWICTFQGRNASHTAARTDSHNRLTTSWIYKGI